MRRRDCLKQIALGALAAAATSSCERKTAETPLPANEQTFNWRMVTSWPPNFPSFGSSAVHLAETIARNSAGRIKIQVYAAGELVPAFEVLDAVSRGTAQMGHSGPIYWRGKLNAAQFFSGIPFGMNALQFNAWMYHGGGLELWRKVYAPFNVIPFLAGNTGAQMAGWFNKEINTMKDLEGLRMRIPGLGGEVFKRAGGVAVNLPGSELFTALASGVIDATEWVGPYNDMAFGLHKAAKYYYYPGWHESAGTMECLINKSEFEALPGDLQSIITTACQAENDLTLTEIAANNRTALETLIDVHDVELRRFSDEILVELRKLARETLEEVANIDAASREVYDAYRLFQEEIARAQALSERFHLDRSAAPRPHTGPGTQ